MKLIKNNILKHPLTLIEALIGIIMLLCAIGFNLWLYRLEPTATTDPNDNAFQFALVDRTNTVWDFALSQCRGRIDFPLCHMSYLIDHWVPNWAQGYNLPFYYSHTPQMVIVGSWRGITGIACQVAQTSSACTMSLFQWYHIVIYLLLCLFPIPVFIGLRAIGAPMILAGIGALFGTHLSTDGLYGLDPTSFLWRGYGLSSQLFAMMFLPIALGYLVSYFTRLSHAPDLPLRKEAIKLFTLITRIGPTNGPLRPVDFWRAVIFLSLTTSGHLGIGIMVFLSAGIISLSLPLILVLTQQPTQTILSTARRAILHLGALATVSIGALSYWIVPTFLANNYHNISFWDPIWKFNSYGWKEIIKNLVSGALLDFGRFPTLTFLTLIGAVAGMLWIARSIERARSKETAESMTPEVTTSLYSVSILFAAWLVLYFGRTTWGGLIDLIPGMTEFHISRFIVGVHMSAFFLIPLGLYFSTELARVVLFGFLKRAFRLDPQALPKTAHTLIGWTLLSIGLAITLPPVYRQTIHYNDLNDTLIVRGNEAASRQQSDFDELMATIRALPSARVFAGRGGSWGKDLQIAETPYYMQISTFGVPTVLWLPETWSPNSDVEQYFSEPVPEHYDLFNMHWVVAPKAQESQPFWRYMKETDVWKFYEVPTTGYFTIGTHAAVVATDKRSYVNLVRLWIQSDYSKLKLFPELTFDRGKLLKTPLPRFEMIDEATYKTLDGATHSLFGSPPIYEAASASATLVGPEEVIGEMIYKTRVSVPDTCPQCLLVLKHSSHPNWVARVDGKKVPHITVFPFFLAIPLANPGVHEVSFSYEPAPLKMGLLYLTMLSGIGLIIAPIVTRRLRKKK